MNKVNLPNQPSNTSSTSSNNSNNSNNLDQVKFLEKLNDLGNKLSIGFHKIGENIIEKLDNAEKANSANTNILNHLALIDENLVSELKESFQQQKLLLTNIKILTSSNEENFNKLLGSASNKELKELSSISLKLDAQSNVLDNLEKAINKEDIANAISLFAQKLTDIEDNQSTDVINILEKVGNLESQIAQSLELNSKVIEKIQPLENYLATMVKAVTSVYQATNELKATHNQTLAKVDKLAETINCLLESETTNESNELETTQTTQNKSFITIIKNKLKALFAPLQRFRTSQSQTN